MARGMEGSVGQIGAHLHDFTTMNQPEGIEVRKGFTLKPNENLDPRDILPNSDYSHSFKQPD